MLLLMSQSGSDGKEKTKPYPNLGIYKTHRMINCAIKIHLLDVIYHLSVIQLASFV